jgi:hypothetical protein
LYAACICCDVDFCVGDPKEEEKDSDDEAPTSLSWSSSTHATSARDVLLAIERAYVLLAHINALASSSSFER